MLETAASADREPSQRAETKPTFAVGERVQVEVSDAFVFAEPVRIERIHELEGTFWYSFEGSATAVPEGQVRRIEQPALGAETAEVEPTEVNVPGREQQRAKASKSLKAFLATERWGKLPDAVALDERVSDANLILIALRATGINYDLPTVGLNMVVRGGGLGRNVVEDANREARRLGLLARWQPGGKPGEKFAYAEERLTFPEPGAFRQRMVWRSWFGGILSRKELAALLYMRAKGRTLRRELEARFRWSSPTAKAALDGLASRRLIMVFATRTATGAFGPTFYETISPVPKDLETAPASKAASRAPDAAQSAKSHAQTPGHGNPGHGNPGHVLTPSEEDLSTPDLATLDLDSPPHTLLRKGDAISLTPPPAASVGEPEDLPSAKNRKNPKPIILRHWASAKFFAIRGIRPTGLNLDHAILDLAGWRALLHQHGGAPPHLCTPAAKTQAEALAGYLSRASRGRLTEYLVLDALAQAVAAACRDGIEVRSLALIGIPMVTAVEKDDLSLVLDRPTRLDADRYAEVSALADEWAPRVAGNGYKVNAELLKSTRQVEELARLLDSYGTTAVVAGINWATDRFKARGTLAPQLPEGEVICGWGWFEPDIKAALAENPQHVQPDTDGQQQAQAAAAARHREQLAQERAKQAEDDERRSRLRARLRLLAPALFERLEAGGVTCKRESMLSHRAIDDAAWELDRHRVNEGQVDAAMQRFCEEAIADRVDALGGWRKTIIARALAPPAPEWQTKLERELQPAIDAIIAALEARGITCDRATLTTGRSLFNLNGRGREMLRDPAGIQLVVEACREHVTETWPTQRLVQRWPQVHKVFTMTALAYKKLQAEQRDIAQAAGDSRGE